MDMDQFETFSISKGYQFYELKKSENYFGHTYVKGYGENTKYLTLYNKYFSYGNNVTYQTSNSNEYLNFKNQIKNYGFVLHSEDTFNEDPYRVFRNKTYEIIIYTLKGGDFEISMKKY